MSELESAADPEPSGADRRTTGEEDAATPDARSGPAVQTTAVSARPPWPPPAERFIGSPLAPERILERLMDGPVRWFEPVGRTSVVFRAVLEDGSHAAFEPATRQHPRGHRAELAAYRIARVLGLDNVPPAITRRVDKETLYARLDPEFRDAWDEIERWTLWHSDGSVSCAAILWVPRARRLGLGREAARRRWGRWLSQDGEVPGDRRPLARDLSNMVAFDYLIGNWDRFDGGIEGTPDGRRLFIRDHNKGFASPLPPVLHERLRDELVRVERFSRELVRRLARLDESVIRAELARDPGHAKGAPLLTDEQLAGVLDRRQAILSHVGALVDAHGEDRVLVFP